MERERAGGREREGGRREREVERGIERERDSPFILFYCMCLLTLCSGWSC